jgi:hypothetical protein
MKEEVLAFGFRDLERIFSIAPAMNPAIVTSLKIAVRIPFGDSWSWTLRGCSLVYSVGFLFWTRRRAPVSAPRLAELAIHLEERGFWDRFPLHRSSGSSDRWSFKPAPLSFPSVRAAQMSPRQRRGGLVVLDAPQWIFHAATSTCQATLAFPDQFVFMDLLGETSRILDVRLPSHG